MYSNETHGHKYDQIIKKAMDFSHNCSIKKLKYGQNRAFMPKEESPIKNLFSSTFLQVGESQSYRMRALNLYK